MDNTLETPKDSPFSEVPVEVTVSVGRARPLVRELMSLRRDSVLTLDKLVSDPVEIYVGNKLIARGELQEVDDGGATRLAVRLSEVAEHVADR